MTRKQATLIGGGFFLFSTHATADESGNLRSETVIKKEEMIAAVKECAARLGHVPSYDEFMKATKISKYHVRKKFGSYTHLAAEAGLEVAGHGHLVEMAVLFEDWALIVRKLKKVPTIAEYDMHSKFSVRPLTRRFTTWASIAPGMRDYIQEQGLDVEWQDVLDVISAQLQAAAARTPIFKDTLRYTAKPTFNPEEPICGPPLVAGPMVYAPTNESGVLLLFGAFARDMGFSILHTQAGFPDCVAMREIEAGRWQRVRIEIEYQSRNFLSHMHPISGCELIVCWEHNWPECPLEVIELGKTVGNLHKCQDCQRSKGENR
jgi:Homing endonuclease associated repeat